MTITANIPEYLAYALVAARFIMGCLGVWSIWIGVNAGLEDKQYAKGAFFVAVGALLIT